MTRMSPTEAKDFIEKQCWSDKKKIEIMEKYTRATLVILLFDLIPPNKKEKKEFAGFLKDLQDVGIEL